MGSFKAVDPDDFSTHFFKTYWETVRDDVISTVRDFFHYGSLHPSINSCNIVLIPKSKNPTSLNHFHPISVCNVSCKVISKILANRLKPMLSKLICPT